MATDTLFVSFSNQNEIVPTEAQSKDLIGSSVDIQGVVAAVGAPASNLSVTTIQVRMDSKEPAIRVIIGVISLILKSLLFL